MRPNGWLQSLMGERNYPISSGKNTAIKRIDQLALPNSPLLCNVPLLCNSYRADGVVGGFDNSTVIADGSGNFSLGDNPYDVTNDE